MNGKLQSLYCYPDTDVLINKFGVRTLRELNVLENEFSLNKINDLLSAPELILNKFGINTLSRIHKYLFGDIYEWAGEFRKEDIAKDGVRFGAVSDIRNAITDVSRYISSKNGFKEESLTEVVKDIALIHGRLMNAHPFREGNGRTIRTFLELVARNAGYELFYGNVDKRSQIQADKASMGETPSSDGLVIMYAQMVLPSESKQRIVLTGTKCEPPFSFPDSFLQSGLKEMKRLGVDGGRCRSTTRGADSRGL